MASYFAIMRRVITQSAWLLWAYPLLIGVAEILIAQSDPRMGGWLHALLLIILTLHAGLGRGEGRRLAQALMLLPLLRILSMTLPLTELPTMVSYAILWTPLVIAMVIVIRQLHLTRIDLGLRVDRFPLQLMIAAGGIWLGTLEYTLIDPPQLISAESWEALTLSILALLVFGGLAEEFLFRGLLQSTAWTTLGRWTILYVALLFAALYGSYLSLPVGLFAFGVGLSFAYIAWRSRSIVGVTLAHGLADLTYIWLMPMLETQLNERMFVAVRVAMLTGIALAVTATVILTFRAASIQKSVRRIAPPPTSIEDRRKAAAHPAILMIRILRRRAGFTYTDLAMRTGLSAHLLAEIEMGLRSPQPEHLTTIAYALDVEPHILTSLRAVS